MSAIRLGPEDSSYNQPAMADTGLGDFTKNVAYDTLYHSPVAATWRLSEGFMAKHNIFDDSKMLSPDEANKSYGLDGELKFDEPVRESYASLLMNRKLGDMRQDYEMQSGGQDSWGRKATAIGTSMVSSLADPVNLASMFVGVGESSALSGVQRTTSFLSRGLISPKSIVRLVGEGNPIRFNLAKGAINGLIGTSLVQPFDIAANLEEQNQDTWEQAFHNVAIGTMMSSIFHTGMAGVTHMFKSFRDAAPELDDQTHDAATRAAIADLMQDKPVSSPADVLSVDHKLIENEQQEVNIRNLVSIAQEHLDRLEQLKEQGTITPYQEVRRGLISAMLKNPTSVTAENLASMFELKLNDDVAKMPDAYKFAEGFKQQSKALEPIQINKNLSERFNQFEKELEGLKEKYAKEQGISSDDFEYASEHLSSDQFQKIAKFLASKGYDITGDNVEAVSGAESVVFLTNDKAIKLSMGKGDSIPGLTLTKELEHTIGDWNIQVTDRITPLDRTGMPFENIQVALRMLAKSYGLDLYDMHAGNLGYDSQGNLRIIDDGSFNAERMNPEAKPNPNQSSFLWNMIPKEEKAEASKEQSLIIYNQLLKQIQEAKDNQQQSILDKIQAITDRRKNEQVSGQKVLDNSKPSAQNPELKRVKENRTPEEPITKDTISHDTANLKAENADLAKELGYKNIDELNELNEEISKTTERAKVLKDGIKNGIGCLTQKAL